MLKKIFWTVLGILLLIELSLFYFAPSFLMEEEKRAETSEVVFSGTIEPKGSLYNSLSSLGISPKKIYLLSKSLSSILNPRECKPGDRFELIKDNEGNLKSFKYFFNSLSYCLIQVDEDGNFSAFRKEIPTEKVIIGAKGEIETSLYSAMVSEAIPASQIMNFADVFAWDIDFLTEPRKGDIFRLTWERWTDGKGEVLSEGKILVAVYTGDNTNTAIYFKDRDGHSDYYSLKGESLRRAFLRSPLHYRRISSYFSRRRFHPILRIYRPHLGIDYAAPIGTPVSTIASGTVVFSGWKGGFGRYIKIRHSGGLFTTYGHLSRFVRGIKKGARVKQGQVIGYVGSSGLSTGPHLDFRVNKNGRYVNFLRMNLPRATPIKKEYLNDFKKAKERLLFQLATLPEEPTLLVHQSSD